MLELQSATQEIEAPGGRGGRGGGRRGRRGRVVVRPGPRRGIVRRPWRRPWWRPWWWAPPAPAPLLPLAVTPAGPVAPVAQPYYYTADPWFAWGCGIFWLVFIIVLIIVAATQPAAAVVHTYSYSYGGVG